MYIVYYCVAIFASLVSVFVFNDKINVSHESVLPIILFVLSIFQAIYFHNHRTKKDFNINNDSELTESEWAALAQYIRNSYILSIPLYIPFILFFSIWIKLLTIIIFLFAFSGGAMFWRIRHSKQLTERLEAEDKELAEQIKKEEMGRIK